jgi:hypothetical protein
MSVGYMQEATDFVAGNVFPQIPVPNKSDVYYIYNRGDFFRNNMKKRAPGTPAVAGGYKLATGTYIADVWAEKKIIDDQIRANSDSPLAPDKDATQWLTMQALINRDVNWCDAYFKAGVWGTDIVGVGSGTPTPGSQVLQWDKNGSTPVADILAGHKAMKAATGKFPNTLVLGTDSYFSLLTNAEIIDRLKYGQTAPGPVTVSTNDLAQLFKVKRVLVASAIQTSSAEDMVSNSDTTPDTFGFIAGKHAALYYSADSPGIFEASAGYTFNWTGLMGATAGGMRIKKYRWEIDSADHVEIESAYTFGLVAKYLGYFFSGVVS